MKSPVKDISLYPLTIAFIEEYKVVKKILDWVGIYEFERKRPSRKAAEDPQEFDEYIRDDYTDCDHVC